MTIRVILRNGREQLHITSDLRKQGDWIEAIQSPHNADKMFSILDSDGDLHFYRWRDISIIRLIGTK